MHTKESTNITSITDRMGRFIGQLRNHEGISLNQLAQGLCTVSYLNKVENGEREINKQLTDAFFQRLGKPVEFFERIVDWDEFQQWMHRQEIIAHLNSGNIEQVRECAGTYRKTASGVLDQQFLEIVEINCLALAGASYRELLPFVENTLKMTQPAFGTVPIKALFLSQNEGRLLFAHLQLREEMEGLSSVAEDYRTLLRYLKQSRYESRERVYLLPYVALRVIESDYNEGHFSTALSLCQDTLEELTRERRLYGYDSLLAWKQKLFDAMGCADKTPERLLVQLKMILSYAPKPLKLLIPCDERGNVYCLNQVIRDRRKLLGISQEELADGICAPHTVSRIENNGGRIQRRNRKALLQKVNMSGERYDYEVVTDSYEDYLLRSELDRAVLKKDWDTTKELLALLKKKIPDSPTNLQYLIKTEVNIRLFLPEKHPEKITRQQCVQMVQQAIKLTLPLDIETIDTWPACVLSVNEILLFLSLADSCEKLSQYKKCLSVLYFAKRCLESSTAHVSLYEDLYTKVLTSIASVLGSLERGLESSVIISEATELSVKNMHSAVLAKCFLGEAWNLFDKHTKKPCEKKDIEAEINMLRQAYVAALISGNVVRQNSILAYCRRTYHMELIL